LNITYREFGKIGDQDILEFCLENANGLKLKALNYGAIVTAIEMKNREGKKENISLGFDNLDDYLNFSPYFGAHVGRVAGRLATGKFKIDDNTYEVVRNEGDNHLHGGFDNFSKVIWKVETKIQDNCPSLIFRYTSSSGENGYPGTLKATTTYTLTNEDEWVIDYYAETDEPTLYNPTNHIYFNLTGSVKETVLDHLLFINSNAYVPISDKALPIGTILPSAGSVFDLTKPTPIRKGVESDDEQIAVANQGYDHAFLLSHKEGLPDAILSEERSGRTVYMYTDADSVVVYSGNKLKGNFFIGDYPTVKYSGVTLETQALPDAIHHRGFGNIILRPEKPFSSKTTFRFRVLSKQY